MTSIDLERAAGRVYKYIIRFRQLQTKDIIFIQKPKTFGEKWLLLILLSVILNALKFKFSDQKSWYPGFYRSVLFAIL